MNDNYVSYMGWVVWDGWCEMSGVRWVVWSGAPQPFLEALSIDTATPNIVYTQQAAKPACQEDTNATFSHLLLAQLPRTQFTHSKLPNPHSRKTSPFLEALSTAPATHTRAADQQRHQRKMFIPSIGTATPNDACQEDINATFSHLLLAQLPQIQFTHSNLPNPHARRHQHNIFPPPICTATPKHNLHTATSQTPMPGRHHLF